MGTKTNFRRSRGSRRGLAAFVSFLLLFAFALGQGSSLTAFAVDGTDTASETGTAPVPSVDASTDDTTASSSDATAPQDTTAAEAPAATDAATAAPEPAAPSVRAASGSPRKASTVSQPRRSVASPAAARRSLGRNTSPMTRALAAPPSGALSGGDIGLDFVAAGPFTYNHVSGVGGAYNNRTISKNSGVVESLEGGDFKCGDLVVFFTQVVVDGSAGGSGSVDIDYSFGAETTGQPGIGFDDIVSVSLNSPDTGNVGLDGNETVTLTSETPDPPGDQPGYDQVLGTVRVTNLDPGEHLIVRLVVHLGCLVGSTPTGNIQSAIEGADVVGDGKVSVGQQTVPFKKVEDVAQPGMDVNKTCPASAAIGDTITYTIQIVNTGNETLNLQSVIDTVDGHAGVNITGSFPSSVAANSSVSRTYQYTVLANDPDPLPNSVAVVAKGAISQATLNGSSSCETDITHVPGITVVKECPQSVPFGQDVTFTITVTNTGNEPLTNVSVTDAKLGGDITAAFSIPDPMPVGVDYSNQFTYTPGADEDPVQNSVTASGTGTDSGATDTDTSSCETDITHAPGIDVTKSCPESVPFGEDITYTITVTNTGNEALTGVTVIDSLLGDITDRFDVDLSQGLGVGVTATATVTYTPAPGQDPVDNTVTATGTGADSGVEASDTASCSTEILQPAIQIVKGGPALVHRGDTITYTFEVTNTGEVELFDVALSDPICDAGTIALVDDGDGSGGLAVGEVWRYECTHLVTGDDPDPIPNTATIRGDTSEGEGGQEVTDTDDHVVDIIHPGIAVVKTVSEQTVPVGTTVTYTYVVTNTGDATLYDVSIDDDIMGHIGDIPILEPGQSVTLTKDFVVGDRPVTNVATASGTDILGRGVSASDDASVSPIAGENPPPPAPPTPFTGSDAGRIGLVSIALFGIGVSVVAATRRRRPQRDAA